MAYFPLEIRFFLNFAESENLIFLETQDEDLPENFEPTTQGMRLNAEKFLKIFF